MNLWEIEITGDASDLVDLTHWLPSGPVHLISRNATVLLTGERFEFECDHRMVYDLATRVCADLTAAGRVMHILENPLVPTVVHQMQSDGSRISRGFVLSDLRAGFRVKRAVPDGAGQNALQAIMTELNGSPHLQAAIEASSGRPITWPRLYRALEEVEAYLEDSVSNVGLCSVSDRDRLKHSANSAEVAGVDARHHIGHSKPPRKPMSLHEASELVRTLIEGAAQLMASSRGAA
ncbi:hypothetical protein [Rubrivivax gelatinosus]|uniref:hypothetical protein n=1 Tax=Rubrivivax gelatinosus TaxID=28068 RepID=UPI0012FE73C8|nr:hypothetical protein [Rubrivivax gelatinosus]MBG6080262.1 hypothetical protein [Rubrivivax gelatinosus]